MSSVIGALSSSLDALVEKVASGTKLSVDLLENLKITLMRFQSLLNDAEEKQITDPVVKKWMYELHDVVYEAEDLIDQISSEDLRYRVEADHVLKNFSSFFKRFNKDINSNLQNLSEKLQHLKIQNLGLEESDPNCVWDVTSRNSVVGDESVVYGRDDDTKILKEFLLSENGGSKIGGISIVGMGGLGKTTLAKLVYNDHQVKHKFKVRGWVYISPDLDIFTVTKTIYESLTSKTNETDDLKILQVQLQQTLSDTKFLLVLDDISSVRYVDWTILNEIFNVESVGSKIIVTTRDESFALPMQNFLYVHHLRSLDTEDFWYLLARHVFVERNDRRRHHNLEMIGIEIAKKCGGLPLEAVVLGGILRHNLSDSYWWAVLHSSIWELTNDKVIPALLLSYCYLPGPLKRCFAYCSIFPKNSILEKNMLVQIWIAEGLIPHPKSEKNWEKVAEEYFDELVSRSLIHQCSNDDDKRNFEMHDLVNDLALTVSFPRCGRLGIDKPDNRVRHLSFKRAEYDTFDNLQGLKGLRTFLHLSLQDSPVSYYSMSKNLLFGLLSTETHLHVLSLSHYQSITKLPNSIGNLIYLRYLNLSSTPIKRLSSEICKLYNLQTLLLSKCWELNELPKDMGKLVNLRHLDIRGTKLKEMPIQISTLENLQTLSDFIVSVKDVGLKIGDLGKYPHLRGNLSISQLENVTNPSHAFEANLMMKREIDELELRWSYAATSNSHIQSVVLEQLRPSTDLKILIISGYGGDKLPIWLGDSIFGNIVKLSISECKNCSGLPSLGKLGNLKELLISKMQSVKSIDIEFYGSSSPSFQPFPSLETLRFDHMDEWEEWKLIGGSSPEFPSLTHLLLEYCPKLKGNIPGNLPKLTFLSVKLCPELKGMTPHNLHSLIELELTECPLLMETSHSDDINNITITSSPFDVFSQLTSCLSSLQKMTLKNIPSLTSFPRDGLPKTLHSLHIDYCQNLEFLSHESFHNYSSLEHLTISNSCNSMTSFTLCSLPVLQSLYIGGCKHLKSILIAEDVSQQNLLFLRTITVEFCNELESVSLSGFPIPNLTHLTVRQCEKLYSLPKPMNRLACLHKLKIDGLPNLKPVSRDDLPLSLRLLHG